MQKIQHYRHATSVIYIDNKKILIDPMLGVRRSDPPVMFSNNPRRNPLVDLPVPPDQLLEVDGVIVTHYHNDHFDKTAKKLLDKNIPLLCQTEDEQKFKDAGFVNVAPIKDTTQWLGFRIDRFIGTHGGHILNKKLGVSSSYVIYAEKSTVYVTGDTLLTRAVKKNLRDIQPDFILANAGSAQIKILGRITMNLKDVNTISSIVKSSRIIMVHLDSINHCVETRELIRKKTVRANIYIPDDGELIEYT